MPALRIALLSLALTACASAQTALPAPPAPTPTPTFVVPQSALSPHVTVIAYGDQRFHDPNDPKPNVANPRMRKALVDKITEEHPDAVTMSGDVPYKGTDPNDYANYVTETKPWRDAHLRIYPALGNHELSGGAQAGVEAWWKAFPELNGMRLLLRAAG